MPPSLARGKEMKELGLPVLFRYLPSMEYSMTNLQLSMRNMEDSWDPRFPAAAKPQEEFVSLKFVDTLVCLCLNAAYV
jgi:hypothetical protein